MRHDNVVSSMCQMSFLPYTKSYMGLVSISNSRPFLGLEYYTFVILVNSGTISFHFPTQANFCKLYYYTYHSILLFHSFPTNTFRNVLLHFLSPTFWASFIELFCNTFLMRPIFRIGLIHFCHPSPFWNCVLPFFYTSPFLELYYSTYHSNFLFHCFPASTFRNLLLHFLSPTFFGPVP
jgi:hypothetical protein